MMTPPFSGISRIRVQSSLLEGADAYCLFFTARNIVL